MNSDKVKAGVQRAPHRSLLRACGLNDDDFDNHSLVLQTVTQTLYLGIFT